MLGDITVYVWILTGILINTVLGDEVIRLLDSVFYENRLLDWFLSCPKRIAWWAQPMVLNLWPLLIVLTVVDVTIHKMKG